MISNPVTEQSDKCCGKHGLCSHEILRNEVTEPITSKLAAGKVTYCFFKKFFFWLSLICMLKFGHCLTGDHVIHLRNFCSSMTLKLKLLTK